MRKIYSMIALLMVCMVGMAQSDRKKWTLVDESSPILDEAELVGKTVALQQGFNLESWDHDYFLTSGDEQSTSVTNESVYQFEETGEMSGEDKLYVLKNLANGQYVSNGEKAYVSDIERAFVFTAKIARAVDEANYETETYVNDIVELRRAGDADGQAFVLYSPTDKQYMNFVGNPGFFDPENKWYDTTNWVIFEVEQVAMEGEEAYRNICENDLYQGQVTEKQFPVGTVPGTISQELFDALYKAWEACEQLNNSNEEVTDEQWWAAVEALQKAILAAKKGILPVTAGYYQLVGAAYETIDATAGIYEPAFDAEGNPAPGKGVYAAADGVRWTPNYELITGADYDKAKYIWQLIPTDSEEGDTIPRFYIKNFGTDTYLGTEAGNSKIIPMTADAKEKWGFLPTTEKKWGGNFDVINVTRGNGVSFNTDPSHIVVFWGTAAGPNGFFRFEPVDPAIIEQMADQVEKNRRMEALEKVYATAETAFEKGRVYTVSEDITTEDHEYAHPGVFTDATKASTNAPQTDGDYGPVEYLFDNDVISYFHTAYTGDMAGNMGEEGKELHYLQLNLDEAIQDFTLKYTQRRNNGGWPLKFLVTASEDGEKWTEEGEMLLNYQIAKPADHTGAGGASGYAAFQMSKGYKYLRLSSLDNGQGKLFWHMAELHIYNGGGDYDAENSIYETVDKVYRDELEKQMAIARAEMEKDAATDETIKALEKAVKEFNEHYPDKEILNALLAEAEKWVEAGELLEGLEGEEGLGEMKAGSTAELTADLDAAKALVKEGTMTYNEIEAAKNAVRAALETYHSKLVTPEDGQVITLQSMSINAETLEETANFGNMLYAPNSDLEVVKHGYKEGADNRIETLWKVIKNEDGTFMLRNLYNGHYLGNLSNENNAQVKFTTKTDSAKVTFRSARVAPYFNIVLDSKEGRFANFQAGGNIVVWWEAEGQDNSAFQITIADLDDYDYQAIDVTTNRLQIMTLPFAVEIPVYGAACEVVGMNEEGIHVNAIEDSEIPAGTPFIYYWYAEDDANTAEEEEFVIVDDLDDITYATKAEVRNGLLGTLRTFTVEGAGYGILNARKSQIEATEAGDERTIAANTGLFGANISAVEEEGEMIIPVVGTLSQDLNTGIIANEMVKNVNVDVYTISGVKVRNAVRNISATKGLPAGLYIVGGKKVLVK